MNEEQKVVEILTEENKNMPPQLASNFFSLDWKDVGKAAFMAFFGAVVSAVYQLFLGCATFACLAAFNWFGLLQTAAIVGISTLLAKLLTTSDGKVLGVAKL